jgi:hypothetical protein
LTVQQNMVAAWLVCPPGAPAVRHIVARDQQGRVQWWSPPLWGRPLSPGDRVWWPMPADPFVERASQPAQPRPEREPMELRSVAASPAVPAVAVREQQPSADANPVTQSTAGVAAVAAAGSAAQGGGSVTPLRGPNPAQQPRPGPPPAPHPHEHHPRGRHHAPAPAVPPVVYRTETR